MPQGNAKTTPLKLPPQSEEAEKSLLGAVLIDKDAVVSIADKVKPEYFYDKNHAKIFESVMELYEDKVPVDLITVAEILKNKKALSKIGGRSYLAKLANSVPTSAHSIFYAEIIKNLYTKRELITAAATINEVAFDEGSTADQAIDRAEQAVFSLSQKHIKGVPVSLKEALAESFDRLDELQKLGSGLRGIPSGFGDLDNILAGMQNSNLIILAARPGIGKTAFALNLARHVAVEEKLPTCIFSLEMSQEELVDRLLIRQAQIDSWKMKTAKLDEGDFNNLSEAMGVLAEAPLYIDDTPGLSVLEIRTKARRLQMESELKLIVVDYLQLIRGRSGIDNRVQEVSEISQGLKNLARELKIPVVAISQLSRGVEARGTQRPRLSDLRESGCLIGDTLLTETNTGSRVRIKDLVGKKDFSVMTLNKQWKLVPVKISRVFPSGRKQTYELTLKSGRKIKASANHPFRGLKGWSRLDELKMGDRLAVPRNIRLVKLADNKKSNNDRLLLLAHLIGDGCFVHCQPLHYTNSDLSLINMVSKAAEKEFEVKPRLVKQETWYHLYLSAEKKLSRGTRNPIVKWLDEELQIYGQRSGEKVIPDFVFGLNEKKLSFFLSHLWATDGCLFLNESKGPRAKIYYASKSEKLIEQVHHLLLRFGIVSTISNSRKESYDLMWQVNIQGKKNQIMFLNRIGCVGKKAKIVQKILPVLSKIKSNPNNDVVPQDVWQIIENSRLKLGWSSRKFHEKMSWSYSGTQRHKNGISRNRLSAIANVLKDEELKDLSKSDVFWDEVKSIKKLGNEEVYDATVPGLHNFVANDIIVHNSIEQDADVVMFLYREDEENREAITCEISKHRNGPVGEFGLFFNPKYISFFDLEGKRG